MLQLQMSSGGKPVGKNIEATDDFGVESVRLLIGGKVVATFLGEIPYGYSWKVKSKFGSSVIISAQAKDIAGNFSEAVIWVGVDKKVGRNKSTGG